MAKLDGVVTATELIQEAKLAFPEISGDTCIELQVFDDEFKEYVDLDVDDVLAPKSKVKVLADKAPAAASSIVSGGDNGDSASATVSNTACADQEYEEEQT